MPYIENRLFEGLLPEDQLTYRKHASFQDAVARNGRPISGAVAFWYRSSDGRVNGRVVECEAVWTTSQNSSYLLGFCHTRQERRTFDIASAWDVRDATSGASYGSLQAWIDARAGSPGAPPSELTQDDLLRLNAPVVHLPADRTIEEVRPLIALLTQDREDTWTFKEVPDGAERAHWFAWRLHPDGRPYSQSHSFLTYWPYHVTYSAMPDGGSEECRRRHDRYPWELRLGMKRVGSYGCSDEAFRQWKALIDSAPRQRARKQVAAPR